MSYHGYSHLIKDYIHRIVPQDKAPTILEVGIDRGVTLIPLVAFLARTREAFAVIGIDIKVQEQVAIVMSNLDLSETQRAFCVEGNSLEVLPKMIEQGLKFNVVLIDGDHNYHTVSKEMAMLEDLTYADSLVICDDYDGRWADKDLWYAERDGYQDVAIATSRVETEKHGVKVAIDEWLAAHPKWQKSQPIKGEPVMLMRNS